MKEMKKTKTKTKIEVEKRRKDVGRVQLLANCKYGIG